MANLVVVELSYTVPPEQVADLRPAHLEWLQGGLDAGKLMLSGRKMPVTGGMLIVKGSVEEVRSWCETDPFFTEGVAEYRYFAFAPSMVSVELTNVSTQ